jgi:adenine-specific DNA-methyltransferase
MQDRLRSATPPESKKTAYGNFSKEQLIAEIKRLKKGKKFGLLWEDKPEDVAELCKTKLPVLVDVEDKAIPDDSNKPTNILIEGDNYHALSVLNYTHKGKIDVIYIDPPYNTGNRDFRYNDKIVDIEDSYRHSKWVSFIYKRLRLARQLLKETGLIFISIDDNELAQLKLLCDTDIFGENNFLACVTWRQLHTVKNNARYFSKSTEYILVYAKNIGRLDKLRQPADKRADYKLNDKDGKGPYKLDPLSARNKNIEYEFSFKKWNLRWKAPLGSYPRYSKETLKKMYEEDEIVYKRGWKEPKAKRYLNKVQEGIPPSSFWDGSEVGFNSNATSELANILSRDAFLSPKPKSLIRRCLEIAVDKSKNSVVLDFMAGSGTTGHAVLELNKKDTGRRQFILCTDNENNICSDVCYPRIKKVIRGYKDSKGEKVEGLGGNLKYFRTEFVDADPTDKNKKKLTEMATDMLCLKEGAFEKIIGKKAFKIYKNTNHYTGIIFDQMAIPDFKEAIAKMKGKFSVYVFSLGDDSFEEEFNGVKQKVVLSPVPEVILRVYRRIFK